MSAQNGKVPSNATRRWRWLAAALGGFLALAVLYGAYWAQVLRYHQSTDDAYVGGNVVQITPQISGTVVAIGADDTQFVKAGQALVRFDQADAKVALDQAEAQLARTVRDVRNLFATSSQLEAAVQQRHTDLTAAQSDLARRQRLPRSRAGAAEALPHARRPAAARRQPCTRGRHDPPGPPAGARRRGRGAQCLPQPRAY